MVLCWAKDSLFFQDKITQTGGCIYEKDSRNPGPYPCLTHLRGSAAVKTYQVTGPVLEVTDSTIVVQKGKDRWELARDKDTNVTGDLKVGNKVTIEYRMNATKVEVKESKKAEAKETKKPAAPKK